MSQKLLREFYELCPDGFCLDLLTEAEKREVSDGRSVYLIGKMHEAERLNGNGRKYPVQTLKREVQKYMSVVKDNRAVGELDHPDDSVVNLKNASHMVTEMWWDGNALMGKIKVLSTPSGMTLRALINDGVKIGISSRGLGSVRESAGATIVEDDFQLICFDIVSEPSTPQAFMDKVVRESKGQDKVSKVKSLIESILKK
jgi:hypothetical protein